MNCPRRTSIMLVGLLITVGVVSASCTGLRTMSEEEAEEQWATSAHADAEAVAFSRWNEDDPAEIPANCAKCHSTTGYHDFLGIDGSTPGTVDKPAPVGTTVECEACHNQTTGERTAAVMPSGIELTGLAKNTNCMDCHQGRASTVSVDEAVADLDDDTVNSDLSFINIHNNAAGPTQYGTEAMGGYEYADQEYLGRYEHVPQFDDCVTCHDAHTLKVNTQKCRACHPGVRSTAHLPTIRMHASDYDGDGNTEEGIEGEIQTMQERLLRAIRLYARLTKGVDDIMYENRNPYFFDTDGERFSTWTPRLLRAAYNYQYTMKGAGGYAHNALYTIQLLHDSLDDLGADRRGTTRP